MTFFYPRLDYAQNVHEAMVYLIFEKGSHRWQHWCFDHLLARRQQYLPESTILETELRHNELGVPITIHDWIPDDFDILIRRFQMVNESGEALTVRLLHYFDLNLGEVAYRNAVRFLRDYSAMVQQWHGFCFVVGGDPFDEWQCGKASPEAFSNAKQGVERGYLSGQTLDIGDVNFAIGWAVHLAPQEKATRCLCILPERSEDRAVRALDEFRQCGVEQWFDETLQSHRRKSCSFSRLFNGATLPPDIAEAFRRALLILPLLFDRHSGACLAAPEFDPCFVESGGYGYCWPRDAAAAVLALVHAGIDTQARRFFSWCRAAQTAEGFWHQRYWLSGDVGPSWCTPDTAIQIDQVGSLVHAMTEYCRVLPADEKKKFGDEMWDTVCRACEYLLSTVDSSGLHSTAYDLWETFRGTFLYSNASIFAALRGAADMADVLGYDAKALCWRDAASRVKKACLSLFWNGERMLRGITEGGDLDHAADSSVLGAFVPFGMLSLDDHLEHGIVESMVNDVRQRLEVEVVGLFDGLRGSGIRRHEHDSYAGGPAAAVNTLWMAQVLLTIAAWENAHGLAEQAQEKTERALCYIRTVLSRTTPTGLLPELMGGPDGAPYWAAPHAWCTALLIECCLLLAKRRGG